MRCRSTHHGCLRPVRFDVVAQLGENTLRSLQLGQSLRPIAASRLKDVLCCSKTLLDLCFPFCVGIRSRPPTRSPCRKPVARAHSVRRSESDTPFRANTVVGFKAIPAVVSRLSSLRSLLILAEESILAPAEERWIDTELRLRSISASTPPFVPGCTHHLDRRCGRLLNEQARKAASPQKRRRIHTQRALTSVNRDAQQFKASKSARRRRLSQNGLRHGAHTLSILSTKPYSPVMSSDRSQPAPKAGASLSERIAALQKKTSNPPRSNNLSPPGTSAGSGSGRLSPGESPSRSPSGGSGLNAVRARIAKFQSSDEKPVMPRSSFGSPAPNPDLRHARSQFPAASAGKGTGAWGEGVLRPQMTGGVWLGGGAGGGWGEPGSASLRPQMTGGAFLGNGAPRASSFGSSRPQRGVSDNVVHGTGRDAFADLDDDLVLTGRNRPETPESSSKEQLASGAASSDATDVLPTLPDTPTAEIDLEKIHASSGLLQAAPPATIPEFPEAPSSAPKDASKVNSAFEGADATPDTSIEIGIHGRSADEVERIRQRAHDLQVSEEEEKAAGDEPWIAPPPADLAGQVPKPIDTSEILAVQAQASKEDSQEPWVQGYGKPAVDRDLETAALSASSQGTLPPADYSASGSLPERAQVERTDSGRVDPLDPAAHQVRGPGLLVPRDEIAEARDLGPDAVKAPLAQSPTTPKSTVVEPTPSGTNGHSAAPAASAANQARQAVAMGRTKSQSQRLRRPPPGTMLSAADLDASDDEYEPGWASVTSVMSSSRS